MREIEIGLLIVVAPLYLLMVTYALAQLSSRKSEYLFGITSLQLWNLIITVIPTVLVGCHTCLPDTEQRSSELLQLTAGYTH
jgi:predicted membrane protein